MDRRLADPEIEGQGLLLRTVAEIESGDPGYLLRINTSTPWQRHPARHTYSSSLPVPSRPGASE
jgi:hypothetical protein